MSKLLEINNYKQEFVNQRKAQKIFSRGKALCLDLNHKGNFSSAIKEQVNNAKSAYICEIKKASPSQGDINVNIDVAKQASIYKEMGATCLSVLTDEKYFKGNDIDVIIAKKASNLPVLGKTFLLLIHIKYMKQKL